jgi:hypothetical protein
MDEINLKSFSDKFFTFTYCKYGITQDSVKVKNRTGEIVFIRKAFTILVYELVSSKTFSQLNLEEVIGIDRCLIPHYKKTHHNDYESNRNYRNKFDLFKIHFYNFINEHNRTENLSKSVCTFEDAKLLAHAGIKQKSQLYWYTDESHHSETKLSDKKLGLDMTYLTGVYYDIKCEKYSAFNYKELLYMLPVSIKILNLVPGKFFAIHLKLQEEGKRAIDALVKLLIAFDENRKAIKLSKQILANSNKKSIIYSIDNQQQTIKYKK